MLSIGTIVGNDPERALKLFPDFYIRGDDGQVFVRGTTEARPFEIEERRTRDSADTRNEARKMAFPTEASRRQRLIL